MANQVFISYTRADEDLARALKDRLRDLEIPCYIDSSRIKAGDNWRSEIRNAIRASAALVVICTSQSVKSNEVTYESAYAAGLGKTVIPVVYEPSLALPGGLGSLDYIDFTDARNRQWDRLSTRIVDAQNHGRATSADLERLGIDQILSGRARLATEFTVAQILERLVSSSELLVVGRSLEAWAREYRGLGGVCERKEVRARLALVDPELPPQEWITPSAYATVDVRPSMEKFRMIPPLTPHTQGSLDIHYLPNAPVFSFTCFEDPMGLCGILELGAGLSFEDRHAFILRRSNNNDLITSILSTCERMFANGTRVHSVGRTEENRKGLE